MIPPEGLTPRFWLISGSENSIGTHLKEEGGGVRA